LVVANLYIFSLYYRPVVPGGAGGAIIIIISSVSDSSAEGGTNGVAPTVSTFSNVDPSSFLAS
jgi:hypothetical protein